MTPLIDLTFLLLIIFMITTPLLQNAVDVSPPSMNADEIPEENSQIIELNNKGAIVYKEREVSLAELGQELERLFISDKTKNILIRADKGQPYGDVLNIMKEAKNAGFKSVQLITQAEGK
jgi:biopolymer transport protein ExbD